MAVNVLGEEVEEPSDKQSPTGTTAEQTYSPYDDLAFVMYVDNDIADLVRSFDEKKKLAVAGKLKDQRLIRRNCFLAISPRFYAYFTLNSFL